MLLLPIYSARETPIEGISSETLLRLIPSHVEKMLVSPEQLYDVLEVLPIEILLTLGAGNIGAMAPRIAEVLRKKEEKA